MVNASELTGFIAGACTTLAFIPQVFKAWQTKSVKDISLIMYLIFCTGLIFWIIHGLYINSLPLILANLITLLLGLCVIVMKFLWENRVE